MYFHTHTHTHTHSGMGGFAQWAEKRRKVAPDTTDDIVEALERQAPPANEEDDEIDEVASFDDKDEDLPPPMRYQDLFARNQRFDEFMERLIQFLWRALFLVLFSIVNTFITVIVMISILSNFYGFDVKSWLASEEISFFSPTAVIHDGYVQFTTENSIPFQVRHTGSSSLTTQYIRYNDIGNSTIDFLSPNTRSGDIELHSQVQWM